VARVASSERVGSERAGARTGKRSKDAETSKEEKNAANERWRLRKEEAETPKGRWR